MERPPLAPTWPELTGKENTARTIGGQSASQDSTPVVKTVPLAVSSSEELREIPLILNDQQQIPIGPESFKDIAQRELGSNRAFRQSPSPGQAMPVASRSALSAALGALTIADAAAKSANRQAAAKFITTVLANSYTAESAVKPEVPPYVPNYQKYNEQVTAPQPAPAVQNKPAGPLNVSPPITAIIQELSQTPVPQPSGPAIPAIGDQMGAVSQQGHEASYGIEPGAVPLDPSHELEAGDVADMQHRLPAPRSQFASTITSPWLWTAVAILLVVYFLAALA